MIGGDGADTFFFTGETGYSRIADFSDNDVIDLSSFGFSDFNDLNIVEQNGTAFIFIDELTSIELTDADAEDLTADAFTL